MSLLFLIFLIFLIVSYVPVYGGTCFFGWIFSLSETKSILTTLKNQEKSVLGEQMCHGLEIAHEMFDRRWSKLVDGSA